MTTSNRHCFVTVALAFVVGGYAPVLPAMAETDHLQLVPRPAVVESGQGSFAVTNKTLIVLDAGSPALKPIGDILKKAIEISRGFRLDVHLADASTASAENINLSIDALRADLGDEGYELSITPQQVKIVAAKPAGVFYGAQSLIQLIMPALHAARNAASEKVELPAMRIFDRPRFAWRGLMLDCSRTFLPVDFLKKYIDVLSFYKMNVLQLHLCDDQGWRLEIRKHPRLTEIGSKFHPAFVGEVNGYYTQAQIRELVEYAAERSVTLVPEIEMPGHSLSLLIAYPELSCRGDQNYVLAPNMFQSDSRADKEPKVASAALCPGNEKTFEVLEDILTETMELFPSEYIHLAGDECPKGYWRECPKCQARIKAEKLHDEEELQSYFFNRVSKFVQSRGRKVFGWDETLEGGLPPGMAMMSWRSMEAGVTAAKMGHPVVMASKSHVYFDFCYNRTPASLVYGYDPIAPELSMPELQSLVLGGQACMWTHMARTEAGIDMSIFPRILALAETLWTPTDRKDWNGFEKRMGRHEPVLKSKNVTCFTRNAGLEPPNITFGQDGRLWLVNERNEIHQRTEDGWKRFPGSARQVTSMPDGTVWCVSTTPANRGYALMRWSASEGQWQRLGQDVSGVQISAAPDGSIWTATEAYAIYRYANDEWKNVLALCSGLSVSPDGTVWVLTMDPVPGGYELYYIPPGGRMRRYLPLMSGARVAAGAANQLWLSHSNGTLYEIADNQPQERPGRVASIAATKDGEVWALTGDAPSQLKLVKWNGQDWAEMGAVP